MRAWRCLRGPLGYGRGGAGWAVALALALALAGVTVTGARGAWAADEGGSAPTGTASVTAAGGGGAAAVQGGGAAAGTASATAVGGGGAAATQGGAAAAGTASATPTGGPPSAGAGLPAGFTLQRLLSRQDGPVAVAFDRAGTPLVAEEGGNGRILRLGASGGSTTVAAGGFPLPLGGLVARAGSIDVAAGGAILQLAESGGHRRPLVVGMRGPLTGLAASADGRLFVGVTGTGHVATLPWTGGPPLVVASGLGTPTGLALSADGAVLYVAADGAAHDAILRLRAAERPGGSPHTLAILPAAAAVAGIAVAPPGPFGPAGTLYLAVVGGVDTLDPGTGAIRPFLTDRGSGGPRRPAGIAFAPGGRALYIADVGDTFANVPLPGTGAVWRVSAGAAALAQSTAAKPALQVSPEPGPQNKARPLPPPLPWYRQAWAAPAAALALILLAVILLAQFRRRRI